MLRDNDIEVTAINGVQKQTTPGKFARHLQYTFTVRGHGPFVLAFPEEHFDAGYAYQAIMRFAADQTDLLDKFSAKG